MRLVWLLVLALVAGAWAQNPDVTIKFDGRLDYRVPTNGRSTQRLYDSLGRPSLLQLSFTLEPGLRAFVSQRLQRIANDGDPELLDEYYVEDQGVWRVGKQIVPFGGGAFLRETVMAALGEVDLPFEGASVAVALCDAGAKRQRGVAGRLSFLDGDVGISAMLGSHWGINGSSFTLYRRPEDSPGQGAGFHQIFGMDAARTFKPVRVRAEFVMLQGRQTSRDLAGNALDLSTTYSPAKNRSYTIGWTRGPQSGDFYRVMAVFETVKNVSIEPMVRFHNGSGMDFSVQLHLHF